MALAYGSVIYENIWSTPQYFSSHNAQTISGYINERCEKSNFLKFATLAECNLMFISGAFAVYDGLGVFAVPVSTMTQPATISSSLNTAPFTEPAIPSHQVQLHAILGPSLPWHMASLL